MDLGARSRFRYGYHDNQIISMLWLKQLNNPLKIMACDKIYLAITECQTIFREW